MLDILKLVIILLLIVTTTIFKIDLFYALLGGSILTSVLFGHGWEILTDFYKTLTDFDVISLMVAFLFVFYLSNLLTDSGILSNMLISLERIVKDVRFVIISLPFMIGLVPAPSGAMLSAPFVQELGSKIGMSSERKLIINYWFRHITEYLNPVYPGPILAVAIAGITFKDLFIINLPIMIFDFILGFILFVSRVKSELSNKDRMTIRDLKVILNGTLPVLIAISLPIVAKLNLALSIAISIALVIILNRVKPQLLKSIIRKSLKYDILLLIFSVMFFKNVLENSKAIELVSKAFLNYNVPHFLIIIVLPLMIGFITGITIGYVGLAFPLLLPFFKENLNLFMLAYVSGYIGVLLSPTHLCFSVTQKYFNASYLKVYKSTIPALGTIMCFAVFLTMIGWYRR